VSNVGIEETFSIQAPIADVWDALTTPERIVVCIPGAALEAGEVEGIYAGTVTVKVGAVSIQYRGTVTFEEVDPDRRFFRLTGKGSEKGGAGSVRMTMQTSLTESGDGGTTVSTTMEMQLAGKIVRFGRGMIQAVSKELFSQFTRCLAQTLPASEAPTSSEDDVPLSSAPRAPDPGQQSVSILPVLWRAFLRWIRGLVGQ